MKKMHNILKIISLCFFGAAILTLLGFVGNMRSSAACESLEIQFLGETTAGFVKESEIRQNIMEASGPLMGNQLGEIDTRMVEEAVIRLPHIKEAAVFKTIDKRLMIEVSERVPAIRLIDIHGTHCYLDEEGYLMPISANASPRLPVVTGHFTIPAEAVKACTHLSDTFMDPRLAGIFTYGRTVLADAFWSAQLQHTEVDRFGDFIVYPQVGSHTINFGPPEELDRKLDMLKTFYGSGMGASNWNKYTAINLKFKDQIVCTKK